MRNYQYNNKAIKQYNNKKGITLIELITIIVVVGVAIPAIMLMWQNLGYNSGRSEAITQAGFFAQELMEEVKSKRFDENSVSPWTASAYLDHEAGEVYPKYDDVDDFHEFPDPNDPNEPDNPPLGAAYTWGVVVDYVELNGSDWESSEGSLTDFKQITVSVSHRLANVSLVTVVSGY